MRLQKNFGTIIVAAHQRGNKNMKHKEFVVRMNRAGELELPNLHDYTVDKYKADNPFFYGPIPYILMFICIAIDIAFFRSLFVKISYDDPVMIILETAGLAFAADVVAAYAGILAKRIKQGLSNDRLNLSLLLGVPIFALIVNGILRVATMSLTTVDGTVDAATIALTIIAIVTPVFTSVGNFSISYLTYDPLAKKMCMEEMGLEEIKDLRRRLSAIRADYEYDDKCAERLIEMDEEHLPNAKIELINDALILCNDIYVKLMEYLGDPTATNVLSKSQCEAIFDRLNSELRAMKKTCTEMKVIDKEHDRQEITLLDVA